MKTMVKSTNDLKSLFPELVRTNKFKRKLDELFNYGYEFTIELAEPLKCFTSKNGNQFKGKIAYNGKAMYMKRMTARNCVVPMSIYENDKSNFIEISDKPCGASKTNNENPVPIYNATRIVIKELDWAILCKKIGMLIKDKLVNVCSCSKCEGTGFLPQFAYYADGVCFQCMGIGKWFTLAK